MKQIDKSQYAIRSATPEDLGDVLSWLEDEWQSEGCSDGFWNNRDLIQSGQRDGELAVLTLTSDGSLVGFLLGGDAGMSIMEIKPQYRRKGFGRALAMHGLQRIEGAGEFGVVIECQPESSKHFWERLGFDHGPALFLNINITPYRAAHGFKKHFGLPVAGNQPVQLRLRLSCSSLSGLLPEREFTSRAAQVCDDEFLLEDRIVALVGDVNAKAQVYIDDKLLWEGPVRNYDAVGVDYRNRFVRMDGFILPGPDE